jgi:hypothetical protein
VAGDEAYQARFQEGNCMKVLFVCGPFGSGTSVVTHILIRLGCLGLKPYYTTYDPKTTNSYETVVFRDLLFSLADEQTFSLLKEKEFIIGEFVKFKEELIELKKASNLNGGEAPVVLKHALCCLLIAELDQVFDAKFIYVRRDIDEIEFGRLRRNWSSALGAEGAKKAYSHMNKFLQSKKEKIYTIRYQHLLVDPIKEVKGLAKFCNLRSNKEWIENAIEPVKRHANYIAMNKDIRLR